MKSTGILAALFLLGFSFACAEEGHGPSVDFHDPFNSPELETRSTRNGEWTFSSGIARSTHAVDPTKKANKGPALVYDRPFNGGTVSFSFRVTGCKTMNCTIGRDKEHLLRCTVTSKRVWSSSVFGPPPPGEKIQPDETSTGDLGFREGEWTTMSIVFRGDKATVRVGEFTTTLQRESLAKPKDNIYVTFSLGTLEMKDLIIKTSNE